MPVSTRFQVRSREQVVSDFGVSNARLAAVAVADTHRASVVEALTLDEQALGNVPDRTDFVNGVPSADFESVRPGNSIVTVLDLATEVVQSVYDLLVVASPYLTGDYQRSITIYADGKSVDSPAEALGAQEVVILPLVPYARKIERGASLQAPDGVFEAVAAIASQRYGNQARVAFTYREPVGGANELESWARDHSERTAEGRAAVRRQYSKDVRQPAVVIQFR